MSVVGIDFGNLNAVIAAARKGGIEILTNEYTYRLTPSMVSLGNKQRFIGEAARPQQTTNFKNTVSQFKRLIGRRYDDPEAQAELQNAPFKHQALPDGRIGIVLHYKDEEHVYTPEQVLAMFFTHLKQTAESNLAPQKVIDVVVSCPNWFNDFQRRAIERSCRYAGLKCVRVLNDTTAAALAYGIYKQDLSETDPRYVAFVDMGHSSLQVAVVGFVKGKLTVKATSADQSLGGRDFDDLLYEHFRKEFMDKNKVDLNTKPRSKIRLLTECEKLKKLMSANTASLPINVECLTDEHDFHSRMGREEFEAMAAPLLARIEPTIMKCLSESGVTVDQLDAVEIVGGSTRVPAVKQIIEKIFNKEISTTLNADEVVARGCAWMAAIVSPTFRVREMKIEDGNPYDVDIEWVTPQGEENKQTIFAKHSNTPVLKQLTWKRSQPFDVTFAYTKPDEVPGAPTVISKYRVTGVKPDANGEPSKIKLTVKANASGIVSVDSALLYEEYMVEVMETDVPKADDKPAGAEEAAAAPEGEAPADGMDTDKAADGASAAPKMEKKIRKVTLGIEAVDAVVTEQQMNECHELEQQMMVNDRMEHERVDAKNALEEYVYESRDKLDGILSEYISESDKEAASAKLSATEDWLYDEGEEEQKSVYVSKLGELKALVQPVQTRAQEWSELPAAEEALRTTIMRFRKVVDLHNAKDEKYDHLEADDVAKLTDECTKADQWLAKESAANAAKTKTQDPSMTCMAVNTKRQALEMALNPIANKPKPKPATPPAAEQTAAGGSEAAPEKTDVPMGDEASAEAKAESNMDVD